MSATYIFASIPIFALVCLVLLGCGVASVSSYQLRKRKGPLDGSAAYNLGRIAVYCEQVRTGAKLAAELGFPAEQRDLVEDALRTEGMKYTIDVRPPNELSVVWIYKYAFTESLLRGLMRCESPSVVNVWAMGKVFGYSDYEIGRFLAQHDLTSTPLPESSSPHDSGTADSSKEQDCSPC